MPRNLEATAPYASVYKPNLAFFEVSGTIGMVALQEVVRAIPAHIPVIADAKRATLAIPPAVTRRDFRDVGFDAVTVNPYLGYDAVAPFLAYRDRGVLLLCRTSNPSARDFQDLLVQSDRGRSGRSMKWWPSVSRAGTSGQLGLVVGATYPQEMRVFVAFVPIYRSSYPASARRVATWR